MGIDFLDIMYRVEKSFGIRFGREDFDFSQNRFLVGDFYDLVEGKVCAASKEILESPDYRARIFYEVRQTLSEELDVEDHWTEKTTLRQLYEHIPETERKKTWRQFRTQIRTERSAKITSVIDEKSNGGFKMLWVGYIIFLAVLPMLFNLLLHYAGGMISAVSFVIVGILILIFWTGYDNYRCRTCVPNITLGEITDEIIAQRKRSLKKDGSPYTREEIEEVVKAALCEALAVKPKDVTPEKDLVRDLGMG